MHGITHLKYEHNLCQLLRVLWERLISDYHRKVDEKCALLGHYAASSSISLATFRDNLSVLSSRFFLDLLTREDGNDGLSRNVGKALPLHTP
jgi:hypothetical protein